MLQTRAGNSNIFEELNKLVFNILTKNTTCISQGTYSERLAKTHNIEEERECNQKQWHWNLHNMHVMEFCVKSIILSSILFIEYCKVE